MAEGYANIRAEVIRRRPLLVYYQTRLAIEGGDGQAAPVDSFLYSLAPKGKPQDDLAIAKNTLGDAVSISTVKSLMTFFEKLLAAGGPRFEKRVRYDGLQKQFAKKGPNLANLAARWKGSDAVVELAKAFFKPASKSSAPTYETAADYAISELPTLTGIPEPALAVEAALGEATVDPGRVRALLLSKFEELFLSIGKITDRVRDALLTNNTISVPAARGGSSSQSASSGGKGSSSSSEPEPPPKPAKASTADTSLYSSLVKEIREIFPVLVYERAKRDMKQGEAVAFIIAVVLQTKTATAAMAQLVAGKQAVVRIDRFFFDTDRELLSEASRLNALYKILLETPSEERFERLKELLPPVSSDLPEIGILTAYVRGAFQRSPPATADAAIDQLVAGSKIEPFDATGQPANVEKFLSWWKNTLAASLASVDTSSVSKQNLYGALKLGLIKSLSALYTQWFSGLLSKERIEGVKKLSEAATLKGHTAPLEKSSRQTSQFRPSSKTAPTSTGPPPVKRPEGQDAYDLPESGGSWMTYKKLLSVKEFTVNQSIDAFPTLGYLLQLAKSIEDECRGSTWQGLYKSGPVPESKGEKNMQLEQVQFVRKPAEWPEGVFVKSVELPEKNPMAVDEALHEIEIGTRLALLQEAKMLYGFSRLYDWYLCKSGVERRVFTVQELAGTQSLARSFTSADGPTVLNRMASLLLALESAQHLVEYVHYDLHSDNAMAYPVPLTKVLVYRRPNGLPMYLQCKGLEAKVIDYGRNRMRSSFLYNSNPSEIVSLIGLEGIGITSRFNPFYDMRLYAITLALLKGNSGEPLILEPQMAPLLGILNDASGHRFLPRESNTPAAQYTEWKKDGQAALRLNMTDDRVRNSYRGKALTTRVTAALDSFYRDGLRGLATMHKEDMLKIKDDDGTSYWESKPADELPVIYGVSSLAVMSYWSWTGITFPGKTPGGLLDSPVFRELTRKPSDSSISLTEATNFRSMTEFLEVGRRMALRTIGE
jgi:hypothetical protein